MLKVVVYSRVSTEEQAGSGLSLEAQDAKLQAYAELFDLDVVEVTEDAGGSAKTLRRPGLQRALSLLESGEADGLVVVKLDRLTRSVSDWQLLIDEYFGEAAGKSLFSVSDSIDTRTAGGRLVLNVLLSVAQWEREAIAERTKDALKVKIQKGERVGSVQYGFKVADDGKTLVKCDEESQVVTMIRCMSDRKISLRRIARELNRRGIPTKKGKGNNDWKHTTIRSIIKLDERTRNTKPAVEKSDHRIGSDYQLSGK